MYGKSACPVLRGAGEQPEMEVSCLLTSDRERSYYIRGCLDIPIKGTDRFFKWGVWCSLSEESYKEMLEHWEDPGRTLLGPYFGWHCIKIPGYPGTVFLKTMVHQKEIGARPYIELETTDHPLAVDQHNGIKEGRLREMVMALLHQYAQ
jgi:hypothetical protein